MGRTKGGKHSHALTMVQKYFPDVKEVHDADENATVEVTANDSKVARVKDHNNCAMAVACKRVFNARGVIVAVGTAYIIKKEGCIRYSLPESVSREIISFDRKAGFAEGTYSLTKPRPSHRLGSQQGAKKWNKGANKRKPFKHFTTGIRVAIGRKG